MLKVVILAMCFEEDIVCKYGVENHKRRLWKAKERKNDNNWGYHQFDGGS